MSRFLRSKTLRNILGVAADWKCERCGVDLQDGWHADHVVPWSDTPRTNVHEMQALCPTCNLTKGTMKLRKHQLVLDRICNEILQGGVPQRKIIASVTPGGGKSLLPQILAKRLIPKIADKICWIVPRSALQQQAAESFLDEHNRNLLSHSLEIRESTNERDPSRGLDGYATTYDAVSELAGVVHRHEFDRHRYILVLDEPHHIAEGSVYHSAVQPLVERAALVLFMSGTLERGDRERIAFLPYRDSEVGEVVDDSDSAEFLGVRYGLQDALQERAIIPLSFKRVDCEAEWIDRGGERDKVESLAKAGAKTSSALWTALNTEYSDSLVDRCVEDWRAHLSHNKRAKMLVVCHSVQAANRISRRLQDCGLRAQIATSTDPKAARKAIDQFKSGRGVQILVTVQMAYEGLDVPSVTHIACLTHIRSRPWIEQMFARATRVDRGAGPYESQHATAFVPDDVLLDEVINKIETAQASAVKAPAIGREPSDDRERNDGGIVPLSSGVTRERESILGGPECSYEETDEIREVLEESNLVGVIPVPRAKLLLENWAKRGGRARPTAEPIASNGNLPKTAKAREAKLRSEIQKLCSHLDRTVFAKYDGETNPGETNKRVVAKFNKRRPEMTEEELEQVLELLEDVKGGNSYRLPSSTKKRRRSGYDAY